VRKVHQATVLKVEEAADRRAVGASISKDEVKRAKQSGNDADADDDGPPDGPHSGWRDLLTGAVVAGRRTGRWWKPSRTRRWQAFDIKETCKSQTNTGSFPPLRSGSG